MPELPPLPELWPHQRQAVEEILDHFTRVNAIFLNAPVGAGKTIIAESVRRELCPDSQSLYVCSSKVLQSQVIHDPSFAHAKLLMGKANYTPHTRNPRLATRMDKMNVSCDDCTWSGKMVEGRLVEDKPCDWCDNRFECPYLRARDAAANAQLAILNTDYWLTEANHVGRFDYRYLAIVDECDLLDMSVTKFAEVGISEQRLRQLGIKAPRGKTTGPDTTKWWVKWIDTEFLPSAELLGGQTRNALKSYTEPTRESLRLSRRLKWLQQLVPQVKHIRDDLSQGADGGWVRVGDADREVIWRPIWPTNHTNKVLWNHATKWLLMSATMHAKEMSARLGWDPRPWEEVRVDSPIPPDRRPIIYLPVAKMSKHSTPDDYEKMQTAVRRLCEVRHPHERVVVHTVSYEMAERITRGLAGLPRKIITYTTARDAPSAIEEYKSAENPNAILVAASQERGLDLPGDLGRASIIVKCPFPNLGDAQVAARLYQKGDYEGGQLWFSLETIHRVIQAGGRTTRGVDDTSTVYILDRAFYDVLWSQVEYHTPLWWRNALVKNVDSELLRLVGVLPPLPEGVVT